MFSVTLETLTVLAEPVLVLAAGLPLAAAPPEPDDEQADAPNASSPSVMTPALARRPVRLPRSALPRR